MRLRFLSIILALLAWAGTLRAGGRTDKITVSDISVKPGTETYLSISINGTDQKAAENRNYRSAQFDITLPEGFSFKRTSYGTIQWMRVASVIPVSFAINIHQVSDQTYRFIICNPENVRFSYASGTILYVRINVPNSLPMTTNYQGAITNQVLGITGNSNYLPDDQTFNISTPGYFKGDRDKGVYGGEFSTNESSDYGDSKFFTLLLDQNEARATDGHAYRSVQYDLHLPKGMTIQQTTSGKYHLTNFSNYTSGFTTSVTYHDEDPDDPFYRIITYNTGGTNFPYRTTTEEGYFTPLYLIYYELDETFVTGDYNIIVDNQVLSIDADHAVTASAMSFTFHHNQTRLFDENQFLSNASATYPVNAQLTATMQAGHWRTFSVPFSLTGDQLREAFGEEVQVAQRPSSPTTEGSTSQIIINYETIDIEQGITAAKPYLICPSKDVSQAQFSSVIVTTSSNKGSSVLVSAVPGIPTYMRGIYKPIAADYSSVTGSDNYTNAIVVSDDLIIGTAGATSLPGFNCVFFGPGTQNLLSNVQNAADIEPTGDIVMKFENGDTRTVEGAIVEENDIRYVAVGRARYEVLDEAYPYADINQDKSITIADVTALVNIILGKTSLEGDITPADINDDSSVTIADVTALVNIILGKSPAPSKVYTVRNASPVVIKIDGHDVFTWGGKDF
ncbi:MAG: dockerin type I repeat-containing protein [Prevotella sp.]|nr:dockerin type I repeat-containing protein [Prevotella sp.]